MPDAVVIGAGPNGLVAANVLADAGWSVVVLEAQSEPGGAVRTAELTLPGFHHDVFSAFYPLAVASPVLQSMGLEHHGLRWCRAPVTLAHPTSDGRCVYVADEVGETAASIDSYHPGDGDGWRRLYGRWEEVDEPLLGALLSSFPPLRHGLRLARTLGPAGLLRLARLATLPVRTLAEEEFAGAGGGLLLAGNALHGDFSPESTLGGFFGWLLACLAQQNGFPVPEGGGGQLADALVRRLQSRGGTVECDAPVTSIEVRHGRRPRCRHRWSRRDRGDEGRARRRRCADAVSGPARARAPARPGARRREAVPLGSLHDQGRLGTRRAGALADRGSATGGHRPRRRLDGPADAVVGRHRQRAGAGRALLDTRSAEPGRSHPLSAGNGHGLGVHPGSSTDTR